MSIDFSKVETVFEHNLTKEEIYGLFVFGDTTREIYIDTLKKAYNTDEQIMASINSSLYMLFKERGDKEKAIEYASRIPDCDDKWFSLLNHCF